MKKQPAKSRNFPEVLEQLQAPELSDKTIYRLSNLQDSEFASFAKVWPQLPVARRQDILSRLVEASEVDVKVDFARVFTLGLGDSDPRVRTSSIEGLWENEDQVLIRPLVRLLRDDPSVLVRETAAVSLGRFALLAELDKISPHLVDLIWQTLWATIHDRQEDLDVRRRAVESIAYLSRPEINDIIEHAYQHEEPRMRASAVFAMGRSADETWAGIVMDELDSNDDEVRYEAARACGALQLSESMSELSKLVADPDSEVKQMAAWSLGQIGGPEARRVLEICAEQGDEALQAAAEEALDEMDFMQGSMDFSMYDFGSSKDQADDVEED